MVMVVTFLVLLSQLSSLQAKDSTACVPNTKTVVSGRTCECNHLGRWTDANCVAGKRASCTPGHVVWQGCSQCICQEDGQLLCNNDQCHTNSSKVPSTTSKTSDLDPSNPWCTPFKYYYINCSICVCPASGVTAEAHCALDNSCQRSPPSSSDFLLSVNKNICIPNVMYLFPCLHCLCSEGGYFLLDKCVETCHRPQLTEPSRRCISRTFYRQNCNICWCPDNSTPDQKLCTKASCHKHSRFSTLEVLRNSVSNEQCRPNSFAKPKCFYCSCNTKGNINLHACLELECIKVNDFKYDITKTTCSPGEMVPVCTECFCPHNGQLNVTYCSKLCSYQSKLSVLELFLKNKQHNQSLDKENIKRTVDNEQCEPNSMYLDQGRYCLCPDNGSTNFKLCTSVTDTTIIRKPLAGHISNVVRIDFNESMPCTPEKFIKFNCNTCYCPKSGKIDPNWCTYDDCNAKKIIEDTHKVIKVKPLPRVESKTCVPGQISKVSCNFCICPDSGLTEDRACTKNKCSEVIPLNDVDEEKFTCEPLDYFLVDCNVCLCPRDGVKNVAKCTKKICEKTFLRSDDCIPGEFFSSDCNVCVCPPNGDKADRVCTNHSCADSVTPWKKIFRLSKNLIDNKVAPMNDRQLDVCFSGEEFEVGCKICTCTDVGLRSFATCMETNCEEEKRVNSNTTDILASTSDPEAAFDVGAEELELLQSRREESCMTLNLTASSEAKPCSAGSMYIIRCRQCICPYMGNINLFCRPLPQGKYCEQPYPYFNYLPAGRRNDEVNGTFTNGTVTVNGTRAVTTHIGNTTGATNKTRHILIKHPHTKYACITAGRVMDACFMCECEEKGLELVEEHCFRSDAPECQHARPSFLDVANKRVRRVPT